MRNIVFRGFNENQNGKEKAFYDGAWHIGDWLQGSLDVREKKTKSAIEDYANNPDNIECFIHYGHLSEWGVPNQCLYKKVAPSTVGQYIGRKSEDQKMIFEGDYIHCKSKHGDVKGFILIKLTTATVVCNFGSADEYLFNCSDIKIVGNVFEKENVEDLYYD